MFQIDYQNTWKEYKNAFYLFTCNFRVQQTEGLTIPIFSD